LNAAVWLTPTAGVPFINPAKTRNPLKFAGVPQTTGLISAASGPKFTISWAHMEEILLLRSFFFRLSNVPWLQRYSPTKSCAMVPRWQIFDDFLRPVFAATAEIRRVKKKELECGPMPNVMAALPNIGSTP